MNITRYTPAYNNNYPVHDEDEDADEHEQYSHKKDVSEYPSYSDLSESFRRVHYQK